MNPRTAAVIVSYQPDLAVLDRLINSLSTTVGKTIVIDNGSDNVAQISPPTDSSDHLLVVSLGQNKGIATALNQGIELAMEQGFEYVILFDQDSLPDPSMISELHKALEAKTSIGKQVACVGPRYVDERTNNPPPFIKTKWIRLVREPCEAGKVTEVDYLITSGSLIPTKSFETCGLMMDSLFIDYVDIEWGLRAKHQGLVSYGVCDAVMAHSLGDEPLSVFGLKLPLRSPLRHYYMFRNAIALYRLKHIPLHWKTADGSRLVARFFVYSLLTKDRLDQFKMMTRGLFHGLRRISGPYC